MHAPKRRPARRPSPSPGDAEPAPRCHWRSNALAPPGRRPRREDPATRSRPNESRVARPSRSPTRTGFFGTFGRSVHCPQHSGWRARPSPETRVPSYCASGASAAGWASCHSRWSPRKPRSGARDLQIGSIGLARAPQTSRDAQAGRDAALALKATAILRPQRRARRDGAGEHRDALPARELADGPTIDALVNNASASARRRGGIARSNLKINSPPAARPLRTRSRLQLAAMGQRRDGLERHGSCPTLSPALRGRLLIPARTGPVWTIADELRAPPSRKQRHEALGYPSNAYGMSKALVRVTRVRLRG